jgi:hypothetical protein
MEFVLSATGWQVRLGHDVIFVYIKNQLKVDPIVMMDKKGRLIVSQKRKRLPEINFQNKFEKGAKKSKRRMVKFFLIHQKNKNPKL